MRFSNKLFAKGVTACLLSYLFLTTFFIICGESENLKGTIGNLNRPMYFMDESQLYISDKLENESTGANGQSLNAGLAKDIGVHKVRPANVQGKELVGEDRKSYEDPGLPRTELTKILPTAPQIIFPISGKLVQMQQHNNWVADRDSFRSFLEAVKPGLIRDGERLGGDEPFLNYYDVALSSWQDVREYEYFRREESYYKGNTSGTNWPDCKFVAMGVSNEAENMSNYRFKGFNKRMSKLGFNSWAWQHGWDRANVTTEQGREWIRRYVSQQTADTLDSDNVFYHHSLNLKHIMTLHDAYYGSHFDTYRIIKGNNDDIPPLTSLPLLEHDDSVIMLAEDDLVMTPFGKEKLALLLKSLPKDQPWIVWPGTCLWIHHESEEEETIHIHPQVVNDATTVPSFPLHMLLNKGRNARCTHHYMMNRLGVGMILKEMEQYALTEDYLPIDMMYTALLKRLEGKMESYYVEPAFTFQTGKAMLIIGSSSEVRDGG